MSDRPRSQEYRYGSSPHFPHPPHEEQKFLRKVSAGMEDMNAVLGRYRIAGPRISPTIEIFAIAGVNLVICFALFLLLIYAKVKILYKGLYYFSSEDISVNDVNAARSYILMYIVMHGYSALMLIAVALTEAYDACSLWLAVAFVELVFIMISAWMTAYHISLVIGMLWLVTILLLFQSTMSLIGFMNSLGVSSAVSIRYPGNIGLLDPYHKENFIDMYDIIRDGNEPRRRSKKKAKGGSQNDHYNMYYDKQPADHFSDTFIVNETDKHKTDKNQLDMQTQAHPSNFSDQVQPGLDLKQDINENVEKSEKKKKKKKKHKHKKKDKSRTNDKSKEKDIIGKKDDAIVVAPVLVSFDPLIAVPKPQESDTVSESSVTAPDGKKKKKKRRDTTKPKNDKVSEKASEPTKPTPSNNNNTIVVDGKPEKINKDKVRDTTKSKKKDKKESKGGNKDSMGNSRGSTYGQFSNARKKSKLGSAGHDRDANSSDSSDASKEKKKKKKK